MVNDLSEIKLFNFECDLDFFRSMPTASTDSVRNPKIPDLGQGLRRYSTLYIIEKMFSENGNLCMILLTDNNRTP